ncbi:hypothetical protein [Nevskia ramosa]|uniref:hypothetical protein n=1 Tax=Nevskia ramosa TaxID=64002 RepID=UPI003D14686B
MQFPIAQNRPIENGGNQIILRGFGGAEKPELIGLDGFLRYQCVNLRGEIFTVADVIRIASNKEGGVHYGADQDKREAELINFRVQAWGVEFFDGSGPGADVVAFAAQQIGFAVLEGLAEIKQAVRDELVSQRHKFGTVTSDR